MSTKSDPLIQSVQYVGIEADEAGRRLDNVLMSRLDVPRAVIYRLIRTGQVRINRGRAKPATRVATGDEIRIPPYRNEAQLAPVIPPDIPMEILHEDDDLMIVNKPSGLAVHAGSRIRFGLIDVLRHYREDTEFLELAHRLDRGSSGCLILARHRAALLGIQKQLRQRQVEKRYWAVVSGHWSGGSREVQAALKVDRHHARGRKVTADESGREALTRFEPLESFAKACLVEARIETGRTHQIRVHAREIGHPIIGDSRYGERSINKQAREQGFRRLFLHAQSVGLKHPVHKTELQVQAPLDQACEEFLAGLREADSN